MSDRLVSSCLPDRVALALEKVDKAYRYKISEIRMRVNNPTTLTIEGQNYYLRANGNINSQGKDFVFLSSAELEEFIYKFCRGSVYAYEESIKQGYITRNGVRVGLCGTVFLKNGEIGGFSSYSSVNVRIPHHISGVSEKLVYDIEQRGFAGGGILVVSPPGDGKTTFLRDISCRLSSGINIGGNKKCFRVCIIDERNEIFMPDVFKNCPVDVLQNCPKEKAIELSLRTLNPEIIICDEIGTESEAKAISKAHTGGIILIASVHGSCMKDVTKYSEINSLIQKRIFKRGVFLHRTRGINQNIVCFESEGVDFYD